MIISLGIDCSIAYQMNKHNKKYILSPFDWIYCEKLSDIIKLIDNRFINFTNIDNYNLVPVKQNTFFGLNNVLEINKQSHFIMKHKYYKIRLPHELETLDDIPKFQIKYSKLIDDFYKCDNITFVRLGKTNDIKYLNELNNVLEKYFDNFDVRFVDISGYDTISWQKDELPWNEILG
jgi:hypothetical protein